MADCDNCGDDVLHVWRHRARTETMTHGKTSWVCADCHPELPGVLKHDAAETEEKPVATDGGEDTEKTVVTDGGSMVCPDCAGTTVNGQGLFACTDCSWSGVR